MKIKRIAWVLAAVGICGPGLAAPDMKPGLWEVTVQLEMPGSPVAMPPIVQTLCFTRQDVEAGAMTLPMGSPEHPSPCKPDNLDIQAASASWTLNCDNLTGQGSLTYSGDSYSGSADITVALDGASQRLKQTFSGRRLGDCEK